jgi:CRP-like cAMP-binding protein
MNGALPQLDDLFAASGQARTRRLAAGERLFSQGQEATGIYFIERGVVRLERPTIDGRLAVVHTGREGQFLAEASLFSGVYHCDATAAAASVVRFHSKRAVLSLLARDSERSRLFLSALARLVQQLRLMLELRNVRKTTERVLLFLELHCDPAAREYHVERHYQDLGNILGVTREALYRALASLERDGAIVRSGSKIKLLGRPS